MKLSGSAYAAARVPDLAARAATVEQDRGWAPALAIVTGSADPTQERYVALKEAAAAAVGVDAGHMPCGPAGADLIRAALAELGRNRAVDALFCQMPLDGVPAAGHADVLSAVPPAKDVDGATGAGPYDPGSPRAAVELLRAAGVPFAGAAVVLAGDHPDGPRTARLLAREGAHPTIPALPAQRPDATVVIVLAGAPLDDAPAWLGDGVAVIDLGYAEPASYVPGAVGDRAQWWVAARDGLGPATVSVLLEHTIAAAEARVMTLPPL